MSHPHDPLMVVRTFTLACNAHDLESALTHFADDATARHTPAPDGVGVYHGKGEIRRWLQPQLSGFHVDTSDYRVTGDLVRWSARVTQNLLRQIGLEDPVAGDLAAVVRDGKIVSFEVTNPTLMSPVSA